MVRFDDAIRNAVESVREAGWRGDMTVVRDPAGSVTVVLDDEVLRDSTWDELAKRLHASLGGFSPSPLRVLLRRSDLIDEQDVLESPDRVLLPEFPKV